MDHHGLRTLALAQHGLATRRQILDLGGTDALIARRIRTGQWARSRRGVIVIGAVAPSWEQRVMAACLAAGDGALASHRTPGATGAWSPGAVASRSSPATSGWSPWIRCTPTGR